MNILEKIQEAKRECDMIQDLPLEEQQEALLMLNVKLDFYNLELEDLEVMAAKSN